MRQYAARILLEKGSKTIEFHGPADITKETTDAIVNAANSSLLGGGGVDGAIHRVGGPQILVECKTIVDRVGRLPAGQAVITKGGNLPARHVIHTVGPVFRGGEHGEADILADCYRESIKLAEAHNLKSIAFPSISTGAFGYPVQSAAQVAVATVINSIASTSFVKKIRFISFDVGTLNAYVAAAQDLCGQTSAFTLEKGSQ